MAGLAGGVTVIAPRVLGAAVTANQAYLVQAGVAAAGTFVLPMLGFRGTYPLIWFTSSAVMIVGDLVSRHLLTMLGLSRYPYSSQLSGPYYPPRLHGADGLGLYPYQGGQYMFNLPDQQNIGAPEAPFEHLYQN